MEMKTKMKIELIDIHVDQEYSQWWIVIGNIYLSGYGERSIISIQKDQHRWMVEIVFVRLDLLLRKLINSINFRLKHSLCKALDGSKQLDFEEELKGKE
jgi:hypothetical protein